MEKIVFSHFVSGQSWNKVVEQTKSVNIMLVIPILFTCHREHGCSQLVETTCVITYYIVTVSFLGFTCVYEECKCLWKKDFVHVHVIRIHASV